MKRIVVAQPEPIEIDVHEKMEPSSGFNKFVATVRNKPEWSFKAWGSTEHAAIGNLVKHNQEFFFVRIYNHREGER